MALFGSGRGFCALLPSSSSSFSLSSSKVVFFVKGRHHFHRRRRLILHYYCRRKEEDIIIMSREGVSRDDDDKKPYKLGLTGSIGTGKSTVAKMLERTLGVPTYDADKVVHELYGENGSAVAPLRALFGEDVIDSKTDAVDRKRLGEKVVGHPDEMAKLEAIVHPLVEEKRKQFIEDFSKKTADVLVFDVPLLFEKRLESTVDGVLVVSCSLETQRERVMSRTEGAKMSVEKFEKIREMQMADEEKRKRATWVIDTEKTMEETEREIERIVEEIRSQREKRIEEVTKE